MLSSYRLGDLVLVNLNDSEQTEILNDHPNSIASDYILAQRDTANANVTKMDLITDIAVKHLQKYVDILPKDISESTLLHLRLGDVVAGTAWHERGKRPIDVEQIKQVVNRINRVNRSRHPTQSNDSKTYVIGRCFFAKPSSINYDECIKLSNAYLQNVLNELHADHFDSGNADIDLCCALKANVFIQGRGFFSKLIVEIRKKLRLAVIETVPHN
jgi:hypothetical protein